MDLFQELKLALGGKPEKVAVLTPFMRRHSFDSTFIIDAILIFLKVHGLEVYLVDLTGRTVLHLVAGMKTM